MIEFILGAIGGLLSHYADKKRLSLFWTYFLIFVAMLSVCLGYMARDYFVLKKEGSFISDLLLAVGISFFLTILLLVFSIIYHVIIQKFRNKKAQ